MAQLNQAIPIQRATLTSGAPCRAFAGRPFRVGQSCQSWRRFLWGLGRKQKQAYQSVPWLTPCSVGGRTKEQFEGFRRHPRPGRQLGRKKTLDRVVSPTESSASEEANFDPQLDSIPIRKRYLQVPVEWCKPKQSWIHRLSSIG